MGVPKQRWTVEEEAALKAGVSKHGPGKWCTILKDPEFSGALCSRSNVDLKDKWRNLCVISIGLGSREKTRIALKRRRESINSDESQGILSIAYVNPDDSNALDVKPLAVVASETVQFTGRDKSVKRLDKYIMEAITNLEEPLGSNKSSIARWIEEQYEERANFREELSARLKVLITKKKLIKMKGNYMKPQKRSSKHLTLDGDQSVLTGKNKDESKPLRKPKIDAELTRMKHMTAEEAAVVAAQAVAEAEAAMAEAEEAVREADALEADAEAAQAFAEAAKQAFIHGNSAKLMLRA